MNLFDLSGEVAVVIGGTGVLGGAMAEGLARPVRASRLLGRNQNAAKPAPAKIKARGRQSQLRPADAQQRESLQAASQEVEKAFGPPTILLNAAGGNDPKVTVSPGRTFQDIGLDDWKRISISTSSAAFCSRVRCSAPSMVSRGKGSIINIASVSSHIPLSRVVAYSAAKAAVLSLSQFLAREWAGKGVRVNSITPGFFPAEQNRKILFHDDGIALPTHPDHLGSHSDGPVWRSPGTDRGGGISGQHKASGFVTGSDIRVDGGFLCQTI